MKKMYALRHKDWSPAEISKILNENEAISWVMGATFPEHFTIYELVPRKIEMKRSLV